MYSAMRNVMGLNRPSMQFKIHKHLNLACLTETRVWLAKISKIPTDISRQCTNKLLNQYVDTVALELEPEDP